MKKIQIVADTGQQALLWARVTYGIESSQLRGVKRLRRRSKDGRGQYEVTYDETA